MLAPKFPENEIQRQAAVEKYELLDTLPEECYDNITSLMAYVCETPISLVTLLDKKRNFLKSHHGIPFNESPREISFCGHAINSDDMITIVEDARLDERFADNPLVTEYQAIFYAGVPLIDPNGYKLGTLCVYDNKPRKLDQNQIDALLAMSKQVMNLFELHYQNLLLRKFQEKLERRNQELDKFASIVSHDLKSPLSNIIALTELLEGDLKGKLDGHSLEYLEHLKKSSYNLKQYIDGLLNYYRSEDYLRHEKEEVDMPSLVEELIEMLGAEDEDIDIYYSGPKRPILVNKIALMQLLINLVGNAVKYNSKAQRRVEIKLHKDSGFYKFQVIDNGDGISPDFIESMFELFSVGGTTDRDGNVGTGIGLAIVKKILTDIGGEVDVSTKLGEGTTISFTILI